MSHVEARQLYRFYNERLEHLGIGVQIQSTAQLSQMDKISAASAGVGLALLDFWIMGRAKMRAVTG